MFVDELRKEISTLDLHPLTKVVLGATWAEPHRIAVIDGDLVIGSDLDASDIPVDFWCEQTHLEDASTHQLLNALAADAADYTEDQLDGTIDIASLSLDDLVDWVVLRHRQREEHRAQQRAWRTFLEWLGHCRLAYRDGQWVKAAPWGSETVDTRPL